MPDPKMHPDEVDTDAELVARLLAAQFPQWAGLPVDRVPSTGTDNAMFRIGDELCARLPRIAWAVGSLRREQELLPVLAPLLPLAVPVAAGIGEPGEGYPYPWSVQPWIAGQPATRGRLAGAEAGDRLDPAEVAADLAGFLRALQGIDTAGGPAPGSGRGKPITERDAEVREAVAELSAMSAAGELGEAGAAWDAGAVLAAWERVMDTPAWSGGAVWIHADLQGGNLLVRDGRLRAVIDFAPNTGDPAVDLLPAWNLFSGKAREVFRAASGADDATWERGRGWALSVALVALPYYQRLGTNPRIVADAWHELGEILHDA